MNGVGKFRGLYVEDVKGDINCFLDMEDVLSDNSSEVFFLLNSLYYLLFDSDSVVYSVLVIKLIFGDLVYFREVSCIIFNFILRIVCWGFVEYLFDFYLSKN